MSAIESRDALEVVRRITSDVVTIDRSDWQFERITEPRPSCYSKLSIERTLRQIVPGGSDQIVGVRVERSWQGVMRTQPYYTVDDVPRLTFSQAVNLLEEIEIEWRSKAELFQQFIEMFQPIAPGAK